MNSINTMAGQLEMQAGGIRTRLEMSGRCNKSGVSRRTPGWGSPTVASPPRCQLRRMHGEGRDLYGLVEFAQRNKQ